MLSPTAILALLCILVGLSLVLWALALRLGLYWVGVPASSLWRVAGATATVAVLYFLVAGGGRLIPLDEATHPLPLVLVQLIVGGLIACLVIGKFFRIELGRAFKAWLPTILTPMVGAIVFAVVFRPILLEAFMIPTNSMAPTLLGWHGVGVCAECGQRAFGGVDAKHVADYEVRMICEPHFHAGRPAEFSRENHGPDRFLAAKFLTPRRWDIIAFRLPEDPSINYCKRIVGLPGETITIRDGAVWANGERLTPPDELRDLKYLGTGEEMAGFDLRMWGSVEHPAILGEDEYFVLGDFSMSSKDSRLFEQGAPGHPPYAIPAENITGVVTTIYWPPDRWRSFR